MAPGAFPHVARGVSARSVPRALRSSRHAAAIKIDKEEMHRDGAQHPSRRRALLAARVRAQHGVATRGDLTAIGFSRRQLEGLLAHGWLHRIHQGVYVVGRRSLSIKGRWMAAVLACGPGALLCHRACGALRRLQRVAPVVIDVTVPTDRRVPGLRTHLRPGVACEERDVVDGIPCTSVAQTLLDLAAVVHRRQLERACDEAEVQRLVTLEELDALLARAKGHRGAAALRATLDEHAIGTTLTRSELEERALALIRGERLPRPIVNADVPGASGRLWQVDFWWPDHRVVLETDGHRFHSTRRAIEHDRRKDADLVAAGQRVLRGSFNQVAREPDLVARMLRVALAAP